MKSESGDNAMVNDCDSSIFIPERKIKPNIAEIYFLFFANVVIVIPSQLNTLLFNSKHQCWYISLTGVGSHVDLEELKHIASSEKNVLSVYDYSSLHKLRDVISRRTCLGKHHVSTA